MSVSGKYIINLKGLKAFLVNWRNDDFCNVEDLLYDDMLTLDRLERYCQCIINVIHHCTL